MPVFILKKRTVKVIPVGGALASSVFRVELKLLSEKALMQLLATQRLLAEEELGSPLLGLMSLRD
jgi:hypothetical protein